MATELKIRRPGKWLTVIPAAATVRRRISELQEELRQLGIILRTAEQLERDTDTSEVTHEH